MVQRYRALCKKETDFCWLGVTLELFFFPLRNHAERHSWLPRSPARANRRTELGWKKWSATGSRRTILLSLSRCQRTRVIIRRNVLCVIIPRVCVWGAPRQHTTQNVNPRLCFFVVCFLTGSLKAYSRRRGSCSACSRVPRCRVRSLCNVSLFLQRGKPNGSASSAVICNPPLCHNSQRASYTHIFKIKREKSK